MNRKLAFPVVVVLAAITTYFLLYQRPGYFAQEPNLLPVTLPTKDGPGNDLILAAATAMRNSVPFEAVLRHEIHLYGVETQALGKYMQQGQGTDKTRLQLRTSLNGETASLLRVSDGRFVFSRIATPEETQLWRVDLRTMNQNLDSAFINSNDASGAGGGGSNWMLGGLSYLLSRLAHEYAFGEPEADLLGETPVWRIRGVLKHDSFQRMSLMQFGTRPPEGSDPAAILPEHVPTEVELILGRVNEPQLFPYAVRFIRKRAAVTQEENTKSLALDDAEQVIATLEFQSIAMNVELDDAEFTYDPGEEEIEYRDEAYLHALQQRFPDAIRSSSNEPLTR